MTAELKIQPKGPCCGRIEMERGCAETQHDHRSQWNVKQKQKATVTEEGNETEEKKKNSENV